MKRYNILNNSLGWACFLIAAVTYLLTIEPTASYWDCPEYITQGFKLEIGHPPGNPVFMLAARFFANFAMGDVTKVALMINAMSALLSAGTILFLFWTITYLVRKLIARQDADSITPTKMIVIFGSGICGALMYAWSDTFWFSAVESEVYAFSSFCTALVFWLILKWNDRAERPDSDKYILLIAYVIGISIAVHLLNLLCIPAIMLVVHYRRHPGRISGRSTLVALLLSFVIVAFVLYGLVPGLVEVAQWFELVCVNTLGMSFSAGVLIYAAVALTIFVATIAVMVHSRSVSPVVVKVMFLLTVLISGVLLLGKSLIAGGVLLAALCVALFIYPRRVPVRALSLASLCIMVMFAGYSSYALLLVRSAAGVPMNEGAPDNVFSLASYLNRDQYGDRPLIYGPTVNFHTDEAGNLTGDNSYVYVMTPTGKRIVNHEGEAIYQPCLKDSAGQPDAYRFTGRKPGYQTSPELNMLFPRMYENSKVASYNTWIGNSKANPMKGTRIEATVLVDSAGNTLKKEPMQKATLLDNIKFLLGYQLNHMYFRYFLWNFAGRQNDIHGQGEPTHGNWLSGIPVLDNVRLGDQSLLPDDLGKGNAGHNVYYMIPLIVGLIGFWWQIRSGRHGKRQCLIIFMLFFMTGLAIVLYLNQTPDQPRERDYAFAGSFYAYAIWVGMGVAGLWRIVMRVLNLISRKRGSRKGKSGEDPDAVYAKRVLTAAWTAAAIGLIVPLQVVSQTWDDHDRSDRYTTRDFAFNYLNSLEPDAIIFTYADNDTYPLWYAQEVEGVRTDVKVLNIFYLGTDWYIEQLRRATYGAPAVRYLMPREAYAYGSHYYFSFPRSTRPPMDACQALEKLYAQSDQATMKFATRDFVIPARRDAALQAGLISAADSVADITMSFTGRSLYLNKLMLLDIVASAAADDWKRPVYFSSQMPGGYLIVPKTHLRQTGMALQVTPAVSECESDTVPRTGFDVDRMYDNITRHWRWGGLDKVTRPGQIYLDETVRGEVERERLAMLNLAIHIGEQALDSVNAGNTSVVPEATSRILTLLRLVKEKLPEAALGYSAIEYYKIAELQRLLYDLTGKREHLDKSLAMLRTSLEHHSPYIRYYQNLPGYLAGTLSSRDKRVVTLFVRTFDRFREYSGSDREAAALQKDLESRYSIKIDKLRRKH